MAEAIRCGLLRDDEVEALVELARAVWHAHYPAIISQEQIDYMLASRYKPALIRQTAARGDRWEVARDGDVLVGFAHGYPMSDGDYKVDKLYVRTDYQRHGIGALLLQALVRHAPGHGCNRLVLRVNRNNASAIAAYQKYGFRVVTEIVEDIGGGFVMDDYVMVKELVAS
jgi:ribosomal protein S18 acetylase RimI-like enzyme